MAITLTNSNVETAGFIANGNSADLSGCETLKAAVSGKSIYLERLIINSAAATALVADASGAGNVTLIAQGFIK